MDKLKFSHLQANNLKLANLAGLADETLFVVEPQASLLGDTGIKLVSKLRIDANTMKTEIDRPRSSLLTGQIKQVNDACDATLDDIKRSIKAGVKSDEFQAASMAKEMVKQRLNPGYAHPRSGFSNSVTALPLEQYLAKPWFDGFKNALQKYKKQ